VIVGFGIDVVEVARIERQLGLPSADRFLARVFTDGERAFCRRFRDAAHRFAARFAAKEAASKALGVPQGITFQDVEVAREGGAPRLILSGVAARAAAALGVSKVHVTLTHDGGVAVAAVVLESGESP
jgi:holo-[acyl-carrier protein] synthase